MKRPILYSTVVVIGIICGLLIFFPWDTAAGTIASQIMRSAADKGISVTVDSSETSGLLAKNFTYSGVNADFPLFRLNAREITVTPSIISSVFSKNKSCRVLVGRGSLVPVTRQSLEWNGGSALLSLNADSLRIEEIAFTGNASLTGFAEISRSTGKFTRAKMLLKAPEEFDRALETAAKTGVVPLKKIKNGEWRIEI